MSTGRIYTPRDVYSYTGNGDVDKLRLALAYGNNSTELYSDEHGCIALHIAALEGHIECMRELLDRGADIESKSNDGYTTLMITALESHIECMRELLDRGADIESKSNKGSTPLMLAASEGHIECMRELLDRDADIESKNNDGYTTLMITALKGQIECMRELLDRGADIERTRNYLGLNALIITAIRGQLDSTRLLLDRGASIDPLIEDDENLNPECKQMILDEVQDRLRRAVFDSFINHHIEYPPLINNIYLTCYPSGDLRVASPAIGWDRAEAVRNKYYFDEVLFYVHVYVANELAKKAKIPQKRTRASSRRCSNIQAYLATNSDDTSTLMTVLANRLKMYLQPK